ncbi:hypothetical protein T23_04810 [Turicibacter faecis]|uniref:Uncharacterized protein n=1 Tax=Turicibacter faecis TaxID=2963365 RepID=A0ABM8IL26_9FIRM|nr:hypothetical protein T23_04810 [Turicibacter sp. TC023]
MKYLISYKRHDGAIDFTGNDVDIYYLFFVVHELGRCLYKMEYDKTFNSSELITLKQLNLEQTVSEIERMLRYIGKHPSPSIELIAHIETYYGEDPLTEIELIEPNGTHSHEELMSDLYLFQLFSHMNLLQGYDFSETDSLKNDYILT